MSETYVKQTLARFICFIVYAIENRTDELSLLCKTLIAETKIHFEKVESNIGV